MKYVSHSRLRIEQQENARLWELRERKRDYENYWHLSEEHRPAVIPRGLASDDEAELKELERRAAIRAADRAGESTR